MKLGTTLEIVQFYLLIKFNWNELIIVKELLLFKCKET